MSLMEHGAKCRTGARARSSGDGEQNYAISEPLARSVKHNEAATHYSALIEQNCGRHRNAMATTTAVTTSRSSSKRFRFQLTACHFTKTRGKERDVACRSRHRRSLLRMICDNERGISSTPQLHLQLKALLFVAAFEMLETHSVLSLLPQRNYLWFVAACSFSNSNLRSVSSESVSPIERIEY